MKKIGLIAGNRNFPLLFSSQAKLKQPSLEIIAVAVKGETQKKLSKFVDKIFWVDAGKVGTALEIFLREKVEKIVLVGQISPYRIFKDRKHWDELMRKIFKNISDFRPHSVFSEIIREFEFQGLSFINSITFLEDCLVKEGVNNNVKVDSSLEEEITKILPLARRIVDLDIGQTIVFKDKAVVAVEALEGTDNTIKRAYKICGPGFLVVKLAKKEQDLRFDVPVIGFKTIKLLKNLGAKAFIGEKNKTLILDKEKVLSVSKKVNIPLIGV